jgi:hypothetical protein
MAPGAVLVQERTSAPPFGPGAELAATPVAATARHPRGARPRHADRDQQPVPQAGGDYDYAALTKELKRLKESHQDKTDVQILSEDPIKFDILVKTMDAAMSAGFPDLSLLDAGNAAL